MASRPIVKKPHGAHDLHRKHRSEEGTDETDQAAEYGNGRGDDVREQDATPSAREPDRPVLPGVAGEVTAVSEETDKDVFGWQVRVETDCHCQSGDGETVADLFHENTGGAEGGRSDELAAEVVDDDTDDDVGYSDDALADEH